MNNYLDKARLGLFYLQKQPGLQIFQVGRQVTKVIRY